MLAIMLIFRSNNYFKPLYEKIALFFTASYNNKISPYKKKSLLYDNLI